MLNFLELEPKSFGLDISDLSLKIARLKKKGSFFKLASWGEIELRKGIIENGEIKDQQALIKEIKKIIQKTKGERLNTKNVIVSLPEKKAFLQVIKMPKMNLKDLKQSVPFEAENYIPLPLEKAYLDFQIVSSINSTQKLNHFNVLIAAIPKNIADSYLFCLKRAGLRTQALEIESQSIIRAAVKGEKNPSPILIIDFGKSVTSLIIFLGSSLRFTSSASINSEDIARAIAEKFKISPKEAESLKIKYGLRKTKNKENQQVVESIIPVLDGLVEEVKKYINYYQDHNKRKIKRVVLCGRGSNLIGFPEFLSSKLKIPTEIANPWVNILPEPLREVPGLSYKESLGYTTALGLALRGVNSRKI